MLSKNNYNEKAQWMETRKDRFSLRKLTIGVASVLIGTVFWLGGNSTVHADEINGQSLSDEVSENYQNQKGTAVEQDKSQLNQSTGSLQDSKNENQSAKQENEATVAQAGTNSTSQLADKEDANKETEPNPQDKTKANEAKSNQSKLVSFMDEDQDNSKYEEVTFKPQNKSDLGKYLLDEKFRAGDSAAQQKAALKKADDSAESQFKNGDADWGSVNIADWDYNNHSGIGSINLTGYHGTDIDHIVIPNDQDFIAQGHVFASGEGVYISADVMHNIIHDNKPRSLAISQTKYGIVKASGSKWSNAFGGGFGGIFNLDNDLARMDLTNLDTSLITDMNSMFAQSANLTTVGDLSAWNTSNVTDMQGMFADTPKLINIGDISKWNVNKVFYFETMFSGTGLTEVGDIGRWQLNTEFNPNPYDPTSNLNFIRIDHMFSGSQFKKLDLSGWNTHNIEYMAGIFADARSLKEINISGWDFSGVKRLPDGNDDPTNVARFAAGNKDQVIIANNLIGLDTAEDLSRVGFKASDFSSNHGDIYGNFISDGHDIVLTNNPVLLSFEKEYEANQKDYQNSRYGFNGLKFYDGKIVETTPTELWPSIASTILPVPAVHRNAWSQLWLSPFTWDNIDSYDGNYYFYMPAFYNSKGEKDPLKVIMSYIQKSVQEETDYLQNDAASPFKGKNFKIHLAGLYFNGKEVSVWPCEDDFLNTPNDLSHHLTSEEAQSRQNAILEQLAREDSNALAIALVNAKYIVSPYSEKTEDKTIKETIHYHFEDGWQAEPDYTASITFEHTVITDGEVVDESWDKASQTFDAVTSPVIEGYTADKPEIGIQTVTPKSTDLIFTVIYKKNSSGGGTDQPTTPQPTQPTSPSAPTNVQPSQPTNPTEPSQPQPVASHASKPESSLPLQPTSEQPHTEHDIVPPVHPETTEKTKHNGTVVHHGNNLPTGKGYVVKPNGQKGRVMIFFNKNHVIHNISLPQTSEKKGINLASIMLGSLAIAVGLVGLGFARKKKDN